MYKKSQFVDYKLGELHNLKNGRNIGKNHSLYKEIMDCFEKNGEGYENTEVLEILLKMGFLINEYVDEGALLRYQSNSSSSVFQKSCRKRHVLTDLANTAFLPVWYYL